VIVLHENGIDPGGGKVARVPHLREKTARVANALGHQDLYFR
jgi:hypothetical protein